jgi:hypothetical protein
MATEVGCWATAAARAESELTATSVNPVFLKTEVKDWQVPSSAV